MAVFLSPVGGAAAQFFDNNGIPLTGGKLHTYEAGTTTNAATYTSSSGGTAHTNPIILDSAGRVPSGEIWLAADTAYKFILKTSVDVLIATWDNISGIGADTPTIYNSTGTGSQTSFALGATPLNENTTDVFINGVYQQKNTYSLSGGSLVFSEAPPVTSSIEVSFT
jgi:hypothetical protein